MKKVAYISHGSEFGGGERSLQLLINSMKGDDSFECVLIVPKVGALSQWAEKNGIRTYYHNVTATSTSKLLLLRVVLWWCSLLIKEGIDIIHANDPSAYRLVAYPAFVLRIPAVCHFRFIQNKDYYEWVFKHTPKPSHFITVSKDSMSQLQSLLPVNCSHIALDSLHNAVDTKSFQPIREKAGNHQHIGIVANLQKVKGHEEFLEIASILNSKNDNYHFHIFGSDIQGQNRLKELVSYSKQLDLDEKTTFHGHVDDVAKAINSLDIVICPSHEEPFGRTVIESMACGKPVIAYAVGGIVEIITDKYDGFLIQKHDINTAADLTNSLLSDLQLYEYISNNAIETVNKKFSANAYFAKNLSIYKEILKM